jgi:multiple sugar transport system substrate-binding protein
LILASIVLLSAACSTSDQVGDASKTVRFVTWKPNQPAAWEQIYAAFEAEYPDIIIEREIGPHSSSSFHDLLTQKLKNESVDVDVFLMDVIWPAEFAAAGWADSLDHDFPAEEREEFFTGAVSANTWNGSVYGVPLYVDSGILYYREDLLDRYGFEPPTTWPEMVEQATTIIAGERDTEPSIYGFSGQFKQYEGLICNMMEYIVSNGGQMIDTGRQKATVGEPPAIDAVRFVRDRIIGELAPEGVLTYEEPESIALFLQGHAIFHRNWPYAWEVANDPEQSRIAGKVGIARLPHFAGNDSVSTLGGWQVGISAFSRNREVAWRFVEFLTSERIQKLLAIKAGLAPTRRALYDDPEVLAAQPQLGDMRTVFDTARPRPRTPLYPAVSNALQRYFSRMISDPSADIETAATQVSREVDRLLSLAR